MKTVVSLFIPAALAVGLFRLAAAPLQRIWKLFIHSACGFLCLWLLNTTGGLTGISIPINALTVVMAGALGLPGIAVLALL